MSVTIFSWRSWTGETSRGLICFNKFIDFSSTTAHDTGAAACTRIKQGNQLDRTWLVIANPFPFQEMWDSRRETIKAFDIISTSWSEKRHEITYECFIIWCKEREQREKQNFADFTQQTSMWWKTWNNGTGKIWPENPWKIFIIIISCEFSASFSSSTWWCFESTRKKLNSNLSSAQQTGRNPFNS